jgi:membrane protein
MEISGASVPRKGSRSRSQTGEAVEGVKIPGRRLVEQAERKGDEAEVPLAQDLGLVSFLKLTFEEVGKDHLAAFAGNLTYKALFALFPLFTLLLSLLGLFNATNLVQTFLDSLTGVLPASALQFISDQLLAIAGQDAEGAFTVGVVVSILLALWGISGAFRSVMDALNAVYEVEEDRPFLKKYGISIFMSVAVIALLLGALLLFVSGLAVGEGLAGALGLGSVFGLVWGIVQWPILAFMVLLAVALIYYFAPAAEQRWRWISVGSVVALVFWVLFSLAFSLYVGTFGSYNETYGSLAGVMVLMLYVYYSAFIILIGAEMNQVIEWHIPGGKDEGDKVPAADRDGTTGAS